MQVQLRNFLFGLKLAVPIFPAYFLLDYFVYPDYKYLLLLIRVGVASYLALVLFFAPRIREKYYFVVIITSTVLAAFAISLMCFITGDGFASSYYAGLIVIIIVTMLFFNIKPQRYALIIAALMAQHFLLLALRPWQFKDLLTNLLMLGGVAVVALFIHQFIYTLIEENKRLQGFLPICANCKKIRDDAGYWHQVEVYIEARAEVEFSHGICPECQEKLYPKRASQRDRAVEAVQS